MQHKRQAVADCFKAASDEAAQHFFSSAHRRSYKNNEVIYLQDDEAENLYLVIDGHVRLSYMMEDGSAVLYAILAPGKVFGELGIFDGGCQCDMAMSVGDSIIGSISANKFKALNERFPELHQDIAMLVAQRYRSYIELTRIMSLRRLQSRISLALLRLADSLDQYASHEGKKYLCVGSVVTQSDLAIMARGSRGNINRTLKVWERAGWIIVKSRTILITDRAALESVALEDGL